MTKINKEGWERRQVGDIFAFIKNGANIKQNKDVVGYPITRIETLSGGVFNPEKVGYAGITDLSKYGAYVLENDDILMSHINSKAYIGRAVIYKDVYNNTFIHGMNLLRLRDIAEGVNADYVCTYFQSQEFKANIAKIRKDAVNQSSFAIADLKKINIPLPPLPIQQRIVEELDEINAIISAKKQQLSKLDELPLSIFNKMFGHPITNEKGWPTKNLDAISKSMGGGTPSKNVPEYWDGDIPWVSSKDMKETYIKDSMLYITQLGMDNSPAKLLPLGTILIVNRSGILKHTLPVAITTAPVTINQDIKALTIDNTYAESIFVLYAIKMFEPYLLSKVKAVTVDSIDFIEFKKLNIPLPPLPLQEAFAARVSAIEEEKAAIAASIEKMQTLLDARMQDYFE